MKLPAFILFLALAVTCLAATGGEGYPFKTAAALSGTMNVMCVQTNPDGTLSTVTVPAQSISTGNTNALTADQQAKLNASFTSQSNVLAAQLSPALSSDFTNKSGSVSIADGLKIVPDGVSVTVSNVTLSTPASIPGGLVAVLNTNLASVFAGPVFSLTNRVIIGTVPSFYGATIGGFVAVSPMNPAGTMSVEVSTDGGTTWTAAGFGGIYKTTVLVSLYDAGGGDDTATNLTVTGYFRPSYVGTTNDYPGQVYRVDDPLYNDGRDVVNVETATSLATGVRAFWSRDAAQSDVNLASHDLVFDSTFRLRSITNQFQLRDSGGNLLMTVTRGVFSGDAPTIETLAVTSSNLTFSILSSSTPTVQYVTNLAAGVWSWADVPSQSAVFSNSLWWVSSPIPGGVTDSSFFRAYTSGTNATASAFAFNGDTFATGLILTNGAGSRFRVSVNTSTNGLNFVPVP